MKIFFKMHYNYAVFNIQIYAWKKGAKYERAKNNLLTYRQLMVTLSQRMCFARFICPFDEWLGSSQCLLFLWHQGDINRFYGNANINFSVSTGSCILFVWQQADVYCFYGYRLIHKLEDVSLDQDDRHSILSTQTLHRPLWNVVAGYSINDINMEINRMSWIDKDGVPIKYALDSYNIPL